jgi:predicted hotdog family 3-hydroxylacyl-ACP dehydratase
MTETETPIELHGLIGLPITEFVLHRKPLLLLDQLIRVDLESAVCEWRVRDGDNFLMPGFGVPSYIGIEYMAQCVAVHAGACERALGFPPPIGMILGTRHFRSSVEYFEPGFTYRATCTEIVSSFDGMGSFDCSILLNDRVIAEARLSVLKKPQRHLNG